MGISDFGMDAIHRIDAMDRIEMLERICAIVQ